MIQNHAYGIKRYILHEEAYIPSLGYRDARSKMFNPVVHRMINPTGKGVFYKKVLSYEETKAIVLSSPWVQEEMEKLIQKRNFLYQKGSYTPKMVNNSSGEMQLRHEVENEADKMLRRIFSNFSMRKLENLIAVLQKVFVSSFKKVIVNDNQIQMLKQVFASRKGPIIFAPTHRSYVDFLVLSTVLFVYGMEVPLICAGEDFLGMPFIGDILRGSGAFFMRRTFRGDDLYKAIFYEYVRFLNKDRQIMEFFIEGTRSRTNKILPPKYGFLSVCTKVFFEKDVEDITIIPVTINYTRTLEDASFPGELRGEKKVKESVSRVIAAYEILKMDFGTMLVDFCEPIYLSEYTKTKMKERPQFDPFKNK